VKPELNEVVRGIVITTQNKGLTATFSQAFCF